MKHQTSTSDKVCRWTSYWLRFVCRCKVTYEEDLDGLTSWEKRKVSIRSVFLRLNVHQRIFFQNKLSFLQPPTTTDMLLTCFFASPSPVQSSPLTATNACTSGRASGREKRLMSPMCTEAATTTAKETTKLRSCCPTTVIGGQRVINPPTTQKVPVMLFVSLLMIIYLICTPRHTASPPKP
ncbi:hypothetical protein B0T20DRAFT_427649 [Sordaria brevicollis]|uniref:Uncharacterized protein n=1 Tax=Sordaria brevicollis TaxID=83679 RepID=A0AAE0NRM5_SORBR|nr:hypothetical protein B0T20DRAFT_427649 [Sordaria brevicollis]